MKKKTFIIKIDIEDEVLAEDEDDAINNFFEDIESTPQQTLSTFISDHTTAIEKKYTNKEIIDFFKIVCKGIKNEYEDGASHRSLQVDLNTLKKMLSMKGGVIK